MAERLHAVVEGHVQGVGFRYFVQEQAARLGLQGWVRNRWEGSVEVMAEGERAALEELVAALRRGPRGAHVSAVDFSWHPAEGSAPGFAIRQTQ